MNIFDDMQSFVSLYKFFGLVSYETYVQIIPLSVEKLSEGRPAIFQARIAIGSPIVVLKW